MAAQPSLDGAVIDLAEYRAEAIGRQYRATLLALEIATEELEEKAAEYRRLEANLNELKNCLAFIRGASRPEVKR
jgi:hypothetical protein